MKKNVLTLLPVPLSLLTSAVQAQSSVTLYGVIDEAFQFVHNATPRTITCTGCRAAICKDPAGG